MSKPGTTWFRSKRKLTALVAGAAILAGTVGAAAPQPETELASTWSIVEATPQIDRNGKIDVEIKVPDSKGDPRLRFGFALKSTWS